MLGVSSREYHASDACPGCRAWVQQNACSSHIRRCDLLMGRLGVQVSWSQKALVSCGLGAMVLSGRPLCTTSVFPLLQVAVCIGGGVLFVYMCQSASGGGGVRF